MERKTPRERDVESLCREPGAEDGVDPRKYFRTDSRPGRTRAVQLAEQVRRTLELVMAGESREPALLELRLLAVEPAPDSTHFLVVVTGDVEEREALLALGRAATWLRTEVATAVHRRKAPFLTFRFIPQGEVRT